MAGVECDRKRGTELVPDFEVSCIKEFEVLKVSLLYDLFIVFVMDPK